MMQDDQIPKRAHDQPLQSHHPEHCAVKIDCRNLLLWRAPAVTRPTTVLAGGAEKLPRRAATAPPSPLRLQDRVVPVACATGFFLRLLEQSVEIGRYDLWSVCRASR